MNGAAYMGRVARLPCCICWRSGIATHGVEVHHQRAGTGGGRRASDWRTIPLCPEHHRGAMGIHGLGTKAFAGVYGVTEVQLVEETWAQVGVAASQVEAWEAAQADRRVASTARVRGKAVVVMDVVASETERAAVAAFRAARLPARPAHAPSPRSPWPKRKLESRNTLKRR